ncbi:hypothetical protein AURDEDRAFT_159640 [Auricularia subglabra TFB-10046 SS5]|nr:hypothetical protein AURDEDRAFT_159640 [Auricularia subglabra TFB-10046 SS5]
MSPQAGGRCTRCRKSHRLSCTHNDPTNADLSRETPEVASPLRQDAAVIDGSATEEESDSDDTISGYSASDRESSVFSSSSSSPSAGWRSPTPEISSTASPASTQRAGSVSSSILSRNLSNPCYTPASTGSSTPTAAASVSPSLRSGSSFARNVQTRGRFDRERTPTPGASEEEQILVPATPIPPPRTPTPAPPPAQATEDEFVSARVRRNTSTVVAESLGRRDTQTAIGLGILGWLALRFVLAAAAAEVDGWRETNVALAARVTGATHDGVSAVFRHAPDFMLVVYVYCILVRCVAGGAPAPEDAIAENAGGD